MVGATLYITKISLLLALFYSACYCCSGRGGVGVDAKNTNKKTTNRSKGCERKVTGKIQRKIQRRVGTSWYQNQKFGGETLPVRFGLPKKYYNTNRRKKKNWLKPVPLVLFFHGFGGTAGSYTDQLDYFSFQKDSSMMTVALTGMGGDATKEDIGTSWNGFGSTSSSSPDNPTCDTDNVYCNAGEDGGDYYYGSDNGDNQQCNCYKDCNGRCQDNCWWTTCQDSVEQTKRILMKILKKYCIDLTQIWAVGSSNGGMFVHELAADQRIAPYLAGIIPMVGLPHFGFNKGPAVIQNQDDYYYPPSPSDDYDYAVSPFDNGGVNPISYLGLWGQKDTVVPPYVTIDSSGGYVPCRSVEEQGWYYTTADCVTDYWGKALGCDSQQQQLEPTFHENALECWSYTNCGGSNSNVEVTGCITNDDHYTYYTYAFQYMVDYIKSHPRVIF